MEIVTEDKSYYCFRKSVSHLPGSFTSFWQAYLKMKTGLKCCFPLSFFILCIYSSSDEECFQSCGVWYSGQSKRMLLGLLQNLEMRHLPQKSPTHTGSCRECRAIPIALSRLILVQVCQISSNQLFLGAVLAFLLLGLSICAVRATIMGESAAILRHIWPHFLLYGQCILPVSPVLTEHFGLHGHNVILASH